MWIWEQQNWEVDQEIDGKIRWGRMEEQVAVKGGRRGMEEGPENGKESSHSAHASGMN